MTHTTSLRIKLIGASAIIMSLNGCSWYHNLITPEKIDYKAAKSSGALDVPPDLTSPVADTHFQIPDSNSGNGTTYSAYSATHGNKSAAAGNQTATCASSEIVLPVPAHVKFERAGSERWLVVDAAPDQVWQLVKAFWQENGFTISQSNPTSGIMQTDWVENSITVPHTAAAPGQIDNSGAVLERDAYRTRLERSTNNPNQTEIYISHRGLVETAEGSANHPAAWRLAPPDPALEGEMLARLMVRLGKDQTEAQAQLAQKNHSDRATLGQNNAGKPILIDNETFDAAWPRVGIALDRIGLNVVNSDRAKGIYYVQHAESPNNSDSDKKPGLLSKLAFWEKHDQHQQYQIELAENAAATNTEVRVLDSKGKPVSAETTDSIIKPLLEQLK